jgi:KDO2-lipid IV(A) lauroyltransferase
MLPDQAPRSARALDRFLRQTGLHDDAGARLTESGAAVIMVWAERLPAARATTSTCSADAADVRQRPKSARSRSVTKSNADPQCPEQYLWGYNRYKRPRGVEAPPEEI